MRVRTAGVLVGATVAFLVTVATGYVVAEANQPDVAVDRGAVTWLITALLFGWVTLLPAYATIFALPAMLLGGQRQRAPVLFGVYGLLVGVALSLALPSFGDASLWVWAPSLGVGGVAAGKVIARYGQDTKAHS